MKIGDLVKMKHEMWWKVRSRVKDYTDQIGIVYSIRGKGIKVAMPDNSVKLGLVGNWEIISEN